jgi:lysophospholipase L1-like esterase
MKYIAVFLLLLNCSCNYSCIKKYDSSPVQVGNKFYGKKVVFIGNSITYGYGTSDNSHRWTTLFSKAERAIEENMGISGQTMQKGSPCGASFDPNTTPTYDSTYAEIIMSLGINDAGYNNGFFNTTSFKNDYETSLSTAKAKGWTKIVLMNIYHPYKWKIYVGQCNVKASTDTVRVNEYNAVIKDLASRYGCTFVNIYDSMRGLDESYFTADGLHPNDKGHAFIAEYLEKVLR